MKRRHWNIALGSAGECAAALDIVEVDNAAPRADLVRARERLRLATLLTLGLTR